MSIFWKDYRKTVTLRSFSFVAQGAALKKRAVRAQKVHLPKTLRIHTNYKKEWVGKEATVKGWDGDED